VLVEDRLGGRVERGERRDAGRQHRHRVRVVAEPFHEPLDVLVHVRVVRDVLLPLVVLLLVRELAVPQQPRDLEEVRLLGQLLDRVSAVAQDPLVAVDEGDRRAARRGVHEGGVVAHHAEVVRVDLDLLEVGGADGLVDDRDGVRLPGARVLDLEVVARRGRLGVSRGSCKLAGHR
jgi:hypothetical protein